jgi:serine/threonine protein kinase
MNQEGLVGQVILGKYKLERCLAKNVSASVYEALCIPLESKVAIKILHPGDRDEEQMERFRREALVTSKLQHPYALKVFDRGEGEDGSLWIAMELLQGETLETFLAREKFISQEKLKEIFAPLCEVLAEAHQKGILHRDLHPGNIMLVPVGEDRCLAKILDFGLAGLTVAPSITDPNEISGTPAYMAPEQWLGLSKAKEQSDIYSLGVVAYQCLSGTLPMEADSPVAWLKAHRKENPLDLWESMKGRFISVSVYDAIMKSIARAPELRPASVKEFWQQLSFVDATQTIADATTPSLPSFSKLPKSSPSQKATTRQFVPIVFSAVALLVSGIAVGLILKTPPVVQIVPATKAAATVPTPSKKILPQSQAAPETQPSETIDIKPEKPASKPISTAPKKMIPKATPIPPEEKPVEVEPPIEPKTDISEITKNPWKNKSPKP